MAPCPLNNVFFNSKKNLMIMNPSYVGWQIQVEEDPKPISHVIANTKFVYK